MYSEKMFVTPCLSAGYHFYMERYFDAAGAPL